MRGLLRPIGERPHGLARATGFIVLAILYCGVISALVTLSLTLALLELPYSPQDSRWALPTGIAWLIVTSLLTTFLLLIGTTRLQRLKWATWWLLLIDAVLRVISALAALTGAPRLIYVYGMNSFFAYDFRQARWSTALASVVVATCTIAVLAWFSRREHRDPATSSVDLYLDPSAT